MAAITIKARREETSAAILPDGTLVRWFDIRLPDYTTLKTEVEVTPNYVESIRFNVSSNHTDRTWEEREAELKYWALSVSTRYSQGLINLLKGSKVSATDYNLKNGSGNERDRGIASADVEIRNPKLGAISFHLTKLCSSDLEPFRSEEAHKTFEEIKASGKYGRYDVIIKEPKVKGSSKSMEVAA